MDLYQASRKKIDKNVVSEQNPDDIIADVEDEHVVDDALPSKCEDVDRNDSVYYSSSEVCSNYSDTKEDVATECKKRA